MKINFGIIVFFVLDRLTCIFVRLSALIPTGRLFSYFLRLL